MSQPHIDRSININVDLSWHVNAKGRILTQDSNNLLSRFPEKIDCIYSLLQIIDAVGCAAVCAGNPDSDFTQLIGRRGGTLCDPKGQVVCILDSTAEVTNHDGHVYGCTLQIQEPFR